jgi:glyoxylase-like metal-dependent hydrolase (beta-lactamase superfamily II)
MADLRVISIGALAAHPLWGEREPVRSGHATCTLIRAGDVNLLVDPGLPDRAMVQRLAERANLGPGDITHVFLTSFHPDTHRGMGAFENATWWISRAEREGVGVPMISALRHSVEQGNEELKNAVQNEVAMLERCEEAPETLADGVDLFPLPGVSPGMCGLIIEGEEATMVVCGDAVATVEHVMRRQILPWAIHVPAAKASFAEALEMGDFLVLGRDNIVPSPGPDGAIRDEPGANDEDEEDDDLNDDGEADDELPDDDEDE